MPAAEGGVGASVSPPWLRFTLGVMSAFAVVGSAAALWYVLARPPCYPGTVELLPVGVVLAVLLWLVLGAWFLLGFLTLVGEDAVICWSF